MSSHVYWLLETDIKEGKLDDLKVLMADMVAATQANEPNTLNYEWWLSEDESQLHIYERYTDSDATMVHLGSFGEHFAGRFMDCVQPTRFQVYGDANEQVRGALSGMGAVFYNEMGGFARS